MFFTGAGASPGAMEANDGSLKAFLAQHPRLMGVLFTLALLLTQVGTAAAQGSGAITTG